MLPLSICKSDECVIHSWFCTSEAEFEPYNKQYEYYYSNLYSINGHFTDYRHLTDSQGLFSAHIHFQKAIMGNHWLY